MSKSKGNIVDPWDVLNAHGADAFRWYLYTSGPPGEPRRFSSDLVGEVVKKFWSTLWNTYSFFVTYANLDGWTPASEQPPVSSRDLLDQWVLAELHRLTKVVTDAYEDYDATGATRPVQEFVEQLSNWYVRLSRRRFWKSESDADKLGAYATLYECLTTIAKLIAPAAPFLSEALYRNLVAGTDKGAVDSVHLSQWPEYDQKLIDKSLLDEMALVQRLVRLGLAARQTAKMRVRQPLAGAEFVLRDSDEAGTVEKYSDLIMSELNVKRVGTTSAETASGMVSLRYELNPLPRLLGKKFGADFSRVQKALKGGDQDFVRPVAEALQAEKPATFSLDGDSFEVTPEEVEVRTFTEIAEGYGVADDSGYWSVVDATLTDSLVNEGLAREVVRRVQNMRRNADFNIADNITVVYTASARLTQAIEQFSDYIRAETLSVSLESGEMNGDLHTEEFDIDGETLKIGVQRVQS